MTRCRELALAMLLTVLVMDAAGMSGCAGKQFDATEFSTVAELDAYSEKHQKIKKNEEFISTRNKLAYAEQEAARQQALIDEALALLSSPPKSEYQARISELEHIANESPNSKLLEQINSEVARLTPLRDVEEADKKARQDAEQAKQKAERYAGSLDRAKKAVAAKNWELGAEMAKAAKDDANGSSQVKQAETLGKKCAQELDKLEKARQKQLAKEMREREILANAEAASSTVRSIFGMAYPEATINWLTESHGVTKNGKRIFVQFEYSVLNAFGTRAQRRYTAYLNLDGTEILDEDDDFLHFRE